MIDEPLGLPKGSVRAILTIILTLTVALLVGFAAQVPEKVFDAWLLAIGYYIGTRVG